MSTLGDDLIQAMTEALAHAKGEGPAIVHDPREEIASALTHGVGAAAAILGASGLTWSPRRGCPSHA